MLEPSAFWSVAAALAVTVAVSALTARLRVLCRDGGFARFTITVFSARCAAGVTLGFVLGGGHVSNWYGRRGVLAHSSPRKPLVSTVFDGRRCTPDNGL